MHPANHLISCCDTPVRTASCSSTSHTIDPTQCSTKKETYDFSTSVIQRITQANIPAKFDPAVILPFAL